jgi:hypothetical protein
MAQKLQLCIEYSENQIQSINRRERFEITGHAVCKENEEYKDFCHKLRIPNGVVCYFTLGNGLIIPFKFRNIRTKVLWLHP